MLQFERVSGMTNTPLLLQDVTEHVELLSGLNILKMLLLAGSLFMKITRVGPPGSAPQSTITETKENQS